jgi:predicted phosphodiesterase
VRIAALYDVHGNVHALEAVLAEADADVLLFGGDLASGPLPRETVELARSVPNAEFILGNADDLSTPVGNPEWEEGRRWVAARLDPGQIEWLESRPPHWAADDTLYAHANPRDLETPVHEWTPEDELAAYAAGVSEQRIVTGHVHMQWRRPAGDAEWICAGSVGMPYEDEPGAYWALLERDGVTFRRTEYDLERAAAAVRASGHPLAEELAAENVLRVPSRAEARAAFGG